MVDTELLRMLRCPQDHSELSVATREVVERLNTQIRAGRVTTVGGQPVHRPIEGGLIRAGGDLLYPVVDGIPIMLQDEAIDLSQM